MTTAGQVAMELRKLADSLDKNSNAEIKAPIVSFYYWGKSEKDQFLATARLMPRPFKKDVSGSNDNPELKITYTSDAIRIYTSIPQSATCELIEPARPAKYRCDPILSDDEDSAMMGEGVFQAINSADAPLPMEVSDGD